MGPLLLLQISLFARTGMKAQLIYILSDADYL